MNAPAPKASSPALAATHPMRDLLGRYAAVFGAAWEARHELAGPKRLADETAFLPAALALQEAPVHPAPRRAMWTIIAIFSFALGWSMVGKVDIVAVAPGRIVVSEGTKIVQPLEAGIVRAIRVKDGDRVRAGQVLIELDPTAANADRETVQAQAAAAQAEASRTRSLLAALQGVMLKTGRSMPGDAHTQAEWADVSARLLRLDAEATRRQAEGATARLTLAKLQATLPLARQREADVSSLAAQGFMALHLGQDRMRERLELERDLATQQARVSEADAALAESQQTRAAYQAETRRMLNDRLAKATLDLAQLQQKGAKAAHLERITQLTSPVAGTVQQLAVRTTGGVVTAAQPLLVVVPDDAELTAEVSIENKDIGFVRVGQEAAVKLDAFNFTRYGTLPAVVKRVSSDAVVDEKRGPIFTATLSLSTQTLAKDNNEPKAAVGMTVTTEIQTGRRTLLEFIFSPLYRTLSESSRER